VELLRQRSRPYLFSNTIAPAIVSASIEVIGLIKNTQELRKKLFSNTTFFRCEIEKQGFEILPGEHPIVPVMIGDATLAQKAADRLLEKGIYVIGFSYPVVPTGKARIRTQISAAHSKEDLEFAVRMFSDVKRELSI
jgi:glycine C-acetyltransferase